LILQCRPAVGTPLPACSFFERQHVDRLVQLGTAQGHQRSFDIGAGLYRCTAAQTALKCVKTRGASGVHEAFWTVFGSRIQQLSQVTLTGPLVSADAQAVFAQLDALVEIVRRRTAYSWLSGIRNDIQYRHHYGVWFPARLKQNEKQSLSRLIAGWQRDPMDIDLDARHLGLLSEFVSSCIFIVALCHAMLARIAERSTVGAKSFVYLVA